MLFGSFLNLRGFHLKFVIKKYDVEGITFTVFFEYGEII